MTQSKIPRVSVIVPGPDQGVAVRVTPPDSRLKVLVRARLGCLEVRIAPEGYQVEVEILPKELIESLGSELFGPGQGEAAGDQGAPGQHFSASSSFLSVEPMEVRFYRGLMEAADTNLVRRLDSSSVLEEVPEDAASKR
ncbi:MAG: hypothetical protein LBE49_01585, partial [Deltaproteobacteria bacterium]|nr:hypothetical protein [Deltaproteobacteria bacterium]